MVAYTHPYRTATRVPVTEKDAFCLSRAAALDKDLLEGTVWGHVPATEGPEMGPERASCRCYSIRSWDGGTEQ